jgi:integrase
VGQLIWLTVTHQPQKTPRRARRSSGLTAVFVRQNKAAGRYGDGNGLYLVVDESGASRWILRVMRHGRRRDIGLGGASTVTLAEARDKAHELRRLAKSGEDPVAARRAVRDGVPTFEVCARKVHESRKAQWRNGKHQAQWLKTVELYAFPSIGQMPINRIGTAEILKLLLPIWTAKPETARRVLQRVSNVIDYGTAAGMRSGENPCRLAILGLPKQTDEPEHFAALPYADVPAFIAKLRKSKAAEITRLAFEFLILNASRSGEVRLAPKREFDLQRALWIIPAERMKGGREHVVPLSQRAIEIVKRGQYLYPDAEFLFPSPTNPARPLSDMSLTEFLRRAEINATAHGFRSSFRDWCSEETGVPSEVAEMALAHAIKSDVEAAYRRGILLEKRRLLMAQWAMFVLGE